MTKKTITVTGLKISYLDNDIHSKKTLVFIHGNSSSADAFKNQLSSPLLESYRRIAIDIPGHGASESSEHYSVAFFSNVIVDFLSHLKLENVILVAHSLGGHIAIQSVPKLKKCIGIFLFGSTLLKSPKSLEEAFLPNPSMEFLFKNILNEEDIDQLTHSLTQGTNKTIIKESIKQTDVLFREKLLSSIQPEGFIDEVTIAENLNLPIAIVIGSDDHFINIDYLKTLVLPTLWNNSIQILSKSKHYPNLEHPKAFNTLLIDFVDSTINNKSGT